MSLLFTLIAPSFAASPSDDEIAARVRAHVEQRIEERLDLVGATPQQRERVHAIVESSRARREVFRAEGKEIRDELRELILAPTIDRAAIETARHDLVDLFDRASTMAIDGFVAMSELLTPEQRAKLLATPK